MVRGRRSGRGSTSSSVPSTSVDPGVRLPDYAGCPDDRVCLPADYAGCPGDRVRLPDYTGCPDDRVRLLPSSVTCPIAFSSRRREPSSSGRGVAQPTGRQPCRISRGKIDPGPASRYITSLMYAHIPGPVDSWKEFPPSVRNLLFDMFTRYMFTRLEDLPRARVV
ncbi:hypothetical protein Taro_051363 [Colocasia esculenta]|uniref:Uncharacterized protein n=1 Tax=Colocasia esculenta TaxID=4460 RepID=A0A843XGI6_COLES|nr:hypothetical protein [Colocasia esculenta]